MREFLTWPFRIAALAGFALGFLGMHLLSPGIDIQAHAEQQTPVFGFAGGSAEQRDAVRELRAQLAGREDEPAEKVFQNIRILRGLSAAQLLRMMETGYSRSLGVDCAHCHVNGDWASEEKPAKQKTREMGQMTRTINTQLLRGFKNGDGEAPVISCNTCHRGQVRPVTEIR
ncbi:MAG: c-type cytochrome [Blastocatellia bacterium]